MTAPQAAVHSARMWDWYEHNHSQIVPCVRGLCHGYEEGDRGMKQSAWQRLTFWLVYGWNHYARRCCSCHSWRQVNPR